MKCLSFIILLTSLFLSCGKENNHDPLPVLDDEEVQRLSQQIDEKLEKNDAITARLGVFKINLNSSNVAENFKKVEARKENLQEIEEILSLVQDYVDNGNFIYQKVNYIQARRVEGKPFEFTQEKEDSVFYRTNDAIDLLEKIESLRNEIFNDLEKKEIEEKIEVKKQEEKLTKGVRELLEQEKTETYQRRNFEQRRISLVNFEKNASLRKKELSKNIKDLENEISETKKRITYLGRNYFAEKWNEAEIRITKQKLERHKEEHKKLKKSQAEMNYRLEALAAAQLQLDKDLEDYEKGGYIPTTLEDVSSVTLGDAIHYKEANLKSLVIHIQFNEQHYIDKIQKIDLDVLLPEGMSLGQRTCSYIVTMSADELTRIQYFTRMNEFFLDRSKIHFIKDYEIPVLQKAIRGIENFGCAMISN